jgi:small ligand-binding sensory domain FIST
MFRFGHATHPNWQNALELAWVQVEGQQQLEQFASERERNQVVGLIYFTESFAARADDILEWLKRRSGVADWIGGVAVGVCATGAEYYQEPAVALMIMEFPANSARVFSGRLPLPKPGTINRSGRSAMAGGIVHVSPDVDDIPGLIEDLASKFTSAHVFGGLLSSAHGGVQIANEVISGGVSGLLLADNVQLDVRVTQGCQPIGPEHIVTKVQGQFALELDDEPALDILMRDLGLDDLAHGDKTIDEAAAMISGRVSRGLFVGLRSESAARTEEVLRFTGAGASSRHDDYRVRPVVGLEPARRSLAIADRAQAGERLMFCVRDEAAARADLIRMCAELREDLDEPAPRLSAFQSAGFAGMKSMRKPKGAIYVVCNGRGAGLFGYSGAEMQLIREQLGDVPMIGFFANGEIRASTLYSYTGILTLIF